MAKSKSTNTLHTAKTNTQLKTTNGKVRKVRVIIKNCINSEEQASKRNAIEKRNETAPSKTRLCCVKLRRTLTDSGKLYNNNNIALQVQCDINNGNQTVNKTLSKDISVKNSLVENVETIRKQKVECNNYNNNEIRHKNNPVVLSSNVSKAMANNTIASTRSKAAEAAYMLCPDKPQYVRTVANKVGLRNQQDSLLHITTKRCIVKLQRIPTTKRKNIVLEQIPIPYKLRRCEVKLQTPAGLRNKDISPKASTIYNTKNNVRFGKTPPLKSNIGDNEYTESVTPSFAFSTPVIDSIKRNNMRKLSLSKSFGKLSENKVIEHIMNSKSSSKHEGGRQEIINNNNVTTLETTTTINDKVTELDPQKTTQISNELRSIKHHPKLSLKRKNIAKDKNITSLTLAQFEPQQNSSIYFNPVRNSTLLELNSSKDTRQEIQNDGSKNNSPVDKSSSQNLANKSEEIENLLNSLDEDEIYLNSKANKNETDDIFIDNTNKIIATQNNISTTNNKINKFFHRKKEDPSVNTLKKPVAQNTKSPKTKEIAKKRRIYVKHSTLAKKRSNVYDFLSQSQSSDTDNIKHADPAADIIKKLIDQGKVQVATNYKGRGKPKFKAKKPLKRQIKTKQTIEKKLKQRKTNNKKVTFTEEKKDDEYEENNHYADHFVNNELFTEHGYDWEIESRDIIFAKLNNRNNGSYANDQQGAFSSLARNVLINQAERSHLHRKNASVMLDKVKKIVSTPKRNNLPSPQTALESYLSPIPMPLPRPSIGASPWRVNDDAHLPKTFNFNTSSGNLPSYSSDFIPLSPVKEKRKIRLNESQQAAIGDTSQTTSKHNSISSIPSVQSAICDVLANTQPHTSNLNEPSVISSFSSNDSNAENMPPSGRTREITNENHNIFDLKHLPNPRRAFKNRSPLKTINILEVVHLPPLKHPNKINPMEIIGEQTEIVGFEKHSGDVSHQGDTSVAAVSVVTQQNYTSEETENYPKEDLFGFEEFLSQAECSSQDNETNNNVTITNTENHTIHDKLQNIRKLKPNENELQENSKNSVKTIPSYHDDIFRIDGMRQRAIKEMLCSTMLHAEASTSKEALRVLNKNKFKDSQRQNMKEDLDRSELFKDPEPETTFNKTDTHRTYTRPHRRKRRLKENNLVLILESDESGNEDNSLEQEKYQHSKESNTSSEQFTKKKRTHKKHKEKSELVEFVEEFNKMCEEVDSYNLIVEKST